MGEAFGEMGSLGANWGKSIQVHSQQKTATHSDFHPLHVMLGR